MRIFIRFFANDNNILDMLLYKQCFYARIRSLIITHLLTLEYTVI